MCSRKIESPAEMLLNVCFLVYAKPHTACLAAAHFGSSDQACSPQSEVVLALVETLLKLEVMALMVRSRI